LDEKNYDSHALPLVITKPMSADYWNKIGFEAGETKRVVLVGSIVHVRAPFTFVLTGEDGSTKTVSGNLEAKVYSTKFDIKPEGVPLQLL